MQRTRLSGSGLSLPGITSGHYIYCVSPGVAGTNNTSGNGTLRVAPWVVNFPLRITRLGAEVTATGDVGSKIRLGIYADNGSTYPGTLVLDAGQIAGDSATVQELTIDVTLVAGLYWVGGVLQSVTTTQPTFRSTQTWSPPVPVPLGTTAPAANGTLTGVSTGSITAALPSTFPGTFAPSGSVIRTFVKAA